MPPPQTRSPETSAPPSTDIGKTKPSGADGVFSGGAGVSSPRPIHQPAPKYSKEARKAEYEGICVLWLVVGADGKPRDLRVHRSLGHGLDEEAIKAVKKWRFEPARKDGQPVAVWVSVEVAFKLY